MKAFAGLSRTNLGAIGFELHDSVRMLSFLRRARSHLRSALETRGVVHLFVGNEAADADSCISPVCAALIAAAAQEKAHLASPVAFVPVIACRRADWPLRREASYLLAQGSSIGSVLDDVAASLLYVDDEDVSAAIASAAALRLTLLDHNTAWGPFAPASDSVCEIIDHHCDRGAHAHVTGAARNISFVPSEGRGVGSTCTLVARRLLDAAAAGAIEPELAAEAAHCLLGVILLDTIGLEEAAGKTTPEDRDAVRDLCALLGGRWPDAAAPSAAAATSISSADPGAGAGLGAASDCAAGDADADADARLTSSLFATLRKLRMDPLWWLSLSVRQACCYDYKLFEYAAHASSGNSASASGSGSAGATGASADAPEGDAACALAPVRIGVAALTIHLSDFLAGKHSGTASSSTSADAAGDSAAAAGGSGAGEIAIAADRAANLRRFVSSSAPEGIAGAADAFMMMSFSDGRRQLALWTAPLKAAGHAAGGAGGSPGRLTDGQIAWLAAQLEGLPLLALRRIPIADGSADGSSALPLLLWEQCNAKPSRKQVDPALAEIIARLPATA